VTRPNAGAVSQRLWFHALIAVSVLLLIITQLSYALAGSGRLSLLLFWAGLGGENNLGAWWSGMLLVLAGVLAFDGFFNPDKPVHEQRGWLALGFALLLLSFDEVASLHEYLSRSRLSLAALGAVGLALAVFGMLQLRRAGVPKRVLARLSFAFGLLASVPVHEMVQQTLEWPNPVIYGVRAMLEEGTEIIAMLIFVSVTRACSGALLRATRDFMIAPVHGRRLITMAAWILWAPLTAATFVLPSPGGPADWLAGSLLMLCALLAARDAVQLGKLDSQAARLVLFYVAASAATNAVKLEWDPVVLGIAVSVRGIVFAVLLVAAVEVLKANQRRVNATRSLVIAALIAGSALVWSTSQILWCGLPPLFALWLYTIESKSATQAAVRREHVRAPLPVPAVHI